MDTSADVPGADDYTFPAVPADPSADTNGADDADDDCQESASPAPASDTGARAHLDADDSLDDSSDDDADDGADDADPFEDPATVNGAHVHSTHVPENKRKRTAAASNAPPSRKHASAAAKPKAPSLIETYVPIHASRVPAASTQCYVFFPNNDGRKSGEAGGSPIVRKGFIVSVPVLPAFIDIRHPLGAQARRTGASAAGKLLSDDEVLTAVFKGRVPTPATHVFFLLCDVSDLPEFSGLGIPTRLVTIGGIMCPTLHDGRPAFFACPMKDQVTSDYRAKKAAQAAAANNAAKRAKTTENGASKVPSDPKMYLAAALRHVTDKLGAIVTSDQWSSLCAKKPTDTLPLTYCLAAAVSVGRKKAMVAREQASKTSGQATKPVARSVPGTVRDDKANNHIEAFIRVLRIRLDAEGLAELETFLGVVSAFA
jgi:hypothetical protein